MGEPAEDAKPNHFFDDLTTDYANNVAFESTIWDLKLIFGEYSDHDKSVEWHTSITIPWAQAKLMQYYLQINVEYFESQHGKIEVPMPPQSQWCLRRTILKPKRSMSSCSGIARSSLRA